MSDEADKAEVNELLRIFRGNSAALELVLTLKFISHVWDDLIDGDKTPTAYTINRAFWMALYDIPHNEFYRAHETRLLPLIGIGMLNWMASNRLGAGDQIGREIAHVARYSIGDICLEIALILGGMDWAELHGPWLKRMAQKDSLTNFLQEMEAKHGPAIQSN